MAFTRAFPRAFTEAFTRALPSMCVVGGLFLT